jgi:hypothetical protein
MDTSDSWAGSARTATPDRPRLEFIEREITTEYARTMVAKALYDVIVDGVGLGPCDLPAGADREWIRGAIAVPIQEATDVALRVLAWRLTQALERAPNGLLDRYDPAHRRVGVDSV